MTWPSSLFLLITAGFSQSYLFWSPFSSPIFLYWIYTNKLITAYSFSASCLYARYSINCLAVLGLLPPALKAWASAFIISLSSGIFMPYFLQVQQQCPNTDFVRSRKRDLQAESCRKACKLLHRILNMNIVSVSVGKALFDKMTAVWCCVYRYVLALPFTLPSKIAFSAPKSSSFLVKLKSSINIMNLSGLPDILSIMSGRE